MEEYFQRYHNSTGCREILCKFISLVLRHYDPCAPLIFQADASSVGAVILQPVENGTLKPVAYASRTLTDAIIFGVVKFRQYLLGRYFL